VGRRRWCGGRGRRDPDPGLDVKAADELSAADSPLPHAPQNQRDRLWDAKPRERVIVGDRVVTFKKPARRGGRRRYSPRAGTLKAALFIVLAAASLTYAVFEFSSSLTPTTGVPTELHSQGAPSITKAEVCGTYTTLDVTNEKFAGEPFSLVLQTDGPAIEASAACNPPLRARLEALPTDAISYVPKEDTELELGSPEKLATWTGIASRATEGAVRVSIINDTGSTVATMAEGFSIDPSRRVAEARNSLSSYLEHIRMVVQAKDGEHPHVRHRSTLETSMLTPSVSATPGLDNAISMRACLEVDDSDIPAMPSCPEFTVDVTRPMEVKVPIQIRPDDKGRINITASLVISAEVDGTPVKQSSVFTSSSTSAAGPTALDRAGKAVNGSTKLVTALGGAAGLFIVAGGILKLVAKVRTWRKSKGQGSAPQERGGYL
jgi:hypothetical protein